VMVRTSLGRTEDVWRRIVLHPVHPKVTQEEAEDMADLVARWAASHS